MSWTALALVVCAAFIHASWNLMAKRAAAAGPTFVFASSVIGAIVYAPWVAIEIARGGLPWNGPVALCLLASGVLHLAYSLCLQRGYQVADLSVVYPVARGTGPLLAATGGFLLLGETPRPVGIAGLVCVVIGIVMIATQGRFDALSRPSGLRGVRWGVATGALIAAYSVVDAWGVKALALAPVVLDWIGNLLRLAMLGPVLARNVSAARAKMTGRWRLALGVGAMSPLSYIFVLAALDLGAPLSAVAPAREMSMMVGALLGLLILREPVGPWRLAGCALVICGVTLLQT